MHGTGAITTIRGDTARIEVVDEGKGGAPTVRERRDDEGGGWGLQIVDDLSVSWGAYEGTTHVWAELAL
jgi:hypothetical protein